MKKFTILAAAAICAFGLTACGSTEEYTEYEQQKVDYAETLATSELSYLGLFMDGTMAQYEIPWDELTMDEVAEEASSLFSITADGYGFYNAVTSFTDAGDTLGAIENIGEATASIDDDQIIVSVPVECANGDGTAEIIFSNDFFMTLESASITQNYTMGDKMEKAALNTLIGMGTVFIVLILISLIISLLGFIPKIQKKAADKKAAKAAEKSAAEAGINNAVNQIIANETAQTAAVSEDESDDCELVAVIAAAIAAYEGSGSTDGFVVRSIRRRR